MKVDETDATLRRIFVRILDTDGALSTTAASSPPAGALQISVNGASFVDGGGTFVHVGAGSYYYEATLPEAHVPGFLAFKYANTGFRTEITWVSVGTIFAKGETDTSKLRLPFTLFDADGNLSAGADTSASNLAISVSGAAYGAVGGTMVEVGSGLYYYQGVVTDASVKSTQLIKYVHAPQQTMLTWIDVEDSGVGGGGGGVGSLLSLVPSDGSLLSPDPKLARWIPIVGTVQCPDGLVPYVFARIGTLPWMIYDGAHEEMMLLFKEHSSVVALPSNTFQITILPNGGWWRSNIEIRFMCGGEAS